MHEDLHSEVVMFIIEKNIDLSLFNIKYLFIGLAHKIWRSNKFKKAYDVNYVRWGKKANVELTGYEQESEQYNFERDKLIQWIEAEFFEYKSDTLIDWYYKRLMKEYHKVGSERKLAEKTGIPKTTIHKDLEFYKKYLKEKYENFSRKNL